MEYTSPLIRTQSDFTPGQMDGVSANELAQEATLRSLRRPLTPAPSEGPVGNSTQSLPSGDPTINIGQIIGYSELGRGAPMQMPSPKPTPLSRFYTPATYTNPNHYEFAHNYGGREERTPLASIPQGKQHAYALRKDWRRPAAIEAAAVSP